MIESHRNGNFFAKAGNGKKIFKAIRQRTNSDRSNFRS